MKELAEMPIRAKYATEAEKAIYDSEGNLIGKVNAQDLDSLINNPDSTLSYYANTDTGKFILNTNNMFTDYGGDEVDIIDNANFSRLSDYFDIEFTGDDSRFTLVRKHNAQFTHPIEIRLIIDATLIYELETIAGGPINPEELVFIIAGLFLPIGNSLGGADGGQFFCSSYYPFSSGYAIQLSEASNQQTKVFMIGDYIAGFADY